MGVLQRYALPKSSCKEHPMLDLVLVALGLAFFALSVGYTVACDRL